MKKNRFLATLLVFTVLLSFTSAVSAKSLQNDTNSQQKYILTQKEISKFNQYVSLRDGQFSIDNIAKKDLSDSEYEKLEFNINKNNQIINEINKDSIMIVDPKKQEVNAKSNNIFAAATTYHEGVTKCDMYWWGARIYLSKTVVNNLGNGIGFGMIWIPEAIVTKIIASIGFALALCPGGVIIDCNLWLAGWNFISPIDVPLNACTFYGWQ